AAGALTIDAAGNWSYSADNGNPEIQALQPGETIVETLTVTTADGSTHDIVITINGAPEAAPPPVEPPPVDEPPPDDEPPPEQEKDPDTRGDGEDPILREITPLPDDSGPPPVAAAGEVPDVFADEEQELQLAKVDPATPRPEQPQLQVIQDKNLSLDKITLQVSDDEALNEQYELQLLERIERMHQGMDGEADRRSADNVDVEIIVGSTVSLTAGIVSWVLRGGSLLASLMSAVPLLNRFDPLPILKTRQDEEDVEPDEDDDSTESQTRQHARRVDNMFSAKQGGQQDRGYADE
ncbi:MAG: VCBS domain-containing protein, partial [Gammaproteobacteria bacterium]|nr:VCBS domain-containing protein [Gammaproteobacteria bacterium]